MKFSPSSSINWLKFSSSDLSFSATTAKWEGVWISFLQLQVAFATFSKVLKYIFPQCFFHQRLFCPWSLSKQKYLQCVRAEIFKIIALLLGRNNVFIKSFRFLLTFRTDKAKLQLDSLGLAVCSCTILSNIIQLTFKMQSVKQFSSHLVF